MVHTFRIYCSACEDHSLAIVNGEVVLTKTDLRDDRQVRAIRFDPLYVDKSVLWAESKEVQGDVYRRIHMIAGVECIFEAELAVPRHSGARLILSRWNGGRNQLWRITPHSAEAPEAAEHAHAHAHARQVQILCQSGEGLCLTVRGGTAVLAHADHRDDRQSFQNTGHVTDGEGHRAFALVNWATGKALKPYTVEERVKLAGHSPPSVDVALLWTQSDDLGEGFHGFRTVNDIDLVLDAAKGVPEFGGAHDGTPIIVFPWNNGPNQKWKLLPFS